MIPFGMPTLLELPRIEDCAKLAGALGLQFIELCMCLPQFQTETMDAAQLLALAKEYHLFYTIHLDDTNTPGEFNPKIAKAYTDTVLETIELARRLSMPILNMHLRLGSYFTMPGRKVFLFEQYEELYFQNLRLFRDQCEKAVGSAPLKICLENTGTFQHPIGKKTVGLLLESPAFALTFDTGHDARSGFAHRPLIDNYQDRLAHIHLHDAILSEQRDHLPLGSGELRLRDYLDFARAHHCGALIEVKTVEGLKESVEWLRTHT